MLHRHVMESRSLRVYSLIVRYVSLDREKEEEEEQMMEKGGTERKTRAKWANDGPIIDGKDVIELIIMKAPNVTKEQEKTNSVWNATKNAPRIKNLYLICERYHHFFTASCGHCLFLTDKYLFRYNENSMKTSRGYIFSTTERTCPQTVIRTN